MAEYVTKIRTSAGDKQIDYNALANLPKADSTLSKEGSFADAKAVGNAIQDIDGQITSINQQLGDINKNFVAETITANKIIGAVYA